MANRKAVLTLESADQKWWNKPLVIFQGRYLPAELAILSMEIRGREKGAWMNSRGTKTGVIDLVQRNENGKRKYFTKRMPLPAFVSVALEHIYDVTKQRRGCADLVVWNAETKRVRLVEVKCPQWDRPSPEQNQFLRVAKSANIMGKVVEWEFCDSAKTTHSQKKLVRLEFPPGATAEEIVSVINKLEKERGHRLSRTEQLRNKRLTEEQKSANAALMERAAAKMDRNITYFEDGLGEAIAQAAETKSKNAKEEKN